MIAEKATRASIGVGIGVVLNVIGFLLLSAADPVRLLGPIVIVLSIVALVWGCANYAEAKGYTKWLGALGVAGLLGLVVLALLPDRHSQA